jgi:hypothetical protein
VTVADDRTRRIADEARPNREAYEPSSWRPVDLATGLTAGPPEAPRLLCRADGLCLVYAGRQHWFMGGPESGKSFAAQYCAATVLLGGSNVLYVDFEGDERDVGDRLMAQGVPIGLLADPDRFAYVRPEEPLTDRGGHATCAQLDLAWLLEHDWHLVVLDGVTESMVLEGFEIESNSDAARWMRLLPRRIVHATGAAVICIDHVTKNPETRGRYAIGGQHKMAGLDGAAYMFTLERPWGRVTSGSSPVEGRVRLHLAKDRVGYVRGQTGADHQVAVIEVAAWPDGGVTIRLLPPGSGDDFDVRMRSIIAAHLAAYPGASKTDLRSLGNSDAVDDEVKRMLAADLVRTESTGRRHYHQLTDAGWALLGAHPANVRAIR